MYPGFLYQWKCARNAAAAMREEHAGHGHGHGHGHRRGRGGPDFRHAGKHGGWFGVRRPLRFMSHRLDLDDDQVKELARILNELKTERAQSEVDHQRAINQIADSLEAEQFDTDKAQTAVKSRLTSAERLEEAVLKALGETHGMLTSEQRGKLAYMLRSGQLTI